MRKKPVHEEMEEESIIFCNFLFGQIPIGRLEHVFEVACNKRESSFAPNAFDVKHAWEGIQAKENEARHLEREKDPIANCRDSEGHINNAGDIALPEHFNLPAGSTAPCWTCRRDEHYEWRQTQKALYGHFTKPQFKVGAKVKSILCSRCGHRFHKEKCDRGSCGCRSSITKGARAEIETISSRDAFTLCIEHNDLVRKIVDDENTRKEAILIWDEGGQVFKLPHRSDIVFTPEMMRKKIAELRLILEEKEKENERLYKSDRRI